MHYKQDYPFRKPLQATHNIKQEKGSGNEIQLTDAMARTISQVPFHGFRFEGTRYDCGNRLGYIEANLAYALDRPDMKERVTEIIAKYR